MKMRKIFAGIMAAALLTTVLVSSAFAGSGFTAVGYQKLLERAFTGGASTTTFQVGLTSTAITGSTTAVSGLTEPSGLGYSRATVTQNINSSTGWPTSAASGTGWLLTAAPIIWTATGTWTTTVTTAFITDGTNVLAWVDLSTPRALQNNDVLTVNFSLKLAN